MPTIAQFAGRMLFRYLEVVVVVGAFIPGVGVRTVLAESEVVRFAARAAAEVEVLFTSAVKPVDGSAPAPFTTFLMMMCALQSTTFHLEVPADGIRAAVGAPRPWKASSPLPLVLWLAGSCCRTRAPT